jgi:hypothetical protein
LESSTRHLPDSHSVQKDGEETGPPPLINHPEYTEIERQTPQESGKRRESKVERPRRSRSLEGKLQSRVGVLLPELLAKYCEAQIRSESRILKARGDDAVLNRLKPGNRQRDVRTVEPNRGRSRLEAQSRYHPTYVIQTPQPQVF